MTDAPPVDAGDQEFLALLVHRGFLTRQDAMRVLKGAAAAGGFESSLAQATGWEPKRVEYLRRTRALEKPEIPGYVVERQLGSGGTSEVFAARSKQNHRRVALKILRPNLALDPPTVKRFVEESKWLAKLDHPAIVRGRRLFKFFDTYVLEMDLVPGRTLAEHLEEGDVFSEERALDVVKQVAEALSAMHAKGVVHRDMKPHNLMIDKAGRVRLIDLGFAGRGMEGRVDEDTTLGTPAYLSPEQATGQSDLDTRADIYSLGVTLYQLVVGRLPFEGGDDSEVMRKQILEGLSGLALKGRNISPSLHYFIEKMMAKDREVRYATPGELAEDIEAHQARQRALEDD